MAGRKTKEESLKAKIEENLAAQAKLVEKLEGLKAVETGLRQQIVDIHTAAKKAEKAKERAAIKAARVKADQGLQYSLSVYTKDVDGLDLAAVAEQVYKK